MLAKGFLLGAAMKKGGIPAFVLEYLVIAGGGGSGGNGGGGGGAGGYREGSIANVLVTDTLSVAVGAGGVAAAGRATGGPVV